MKVIFALIGLLFTLTACGGNETETAPAPVVNNDAIYLGAVHDTAPESKAVSDDLLIELAHSTCDMLDSGSTLTDLFLMSQQSGLSPQFSGATTGAAIAVYCPEYSHILP